MSVTAWFKDKVNWLRTQIYQKASFSWLAEITTARQPWLLGVIPPLKTIFALLLASLVMAGAVWVGTALWAGAIAKATAFLPLLSETLAWVLGTAVVNFWFSRDINRALYSTRDDRDIFVYSQKVNPTKLYQMVEHLTHEVNAHFENKLGEKHIPMPVPSILTYTQDDIEVTSFGRNPKTSALFIATGTLNYTKNNLNQRKLAALIEKELVKIYLNRGLSRTIVSMGATLANTLNMLSSSDVFLFRAIGFLTGPIQFVLFLEKSINRQYEYEASGHVIQCGRGLDLYAAIDCGVNPNLETTPPFRDIKANQDRRQRQPYTGMFSTILSPITEWVRRNEIAEYNKLGTGFFDYLNAFMDHCVAEGLFVIREWAKAKPRATNEKTEARKQIKARIGNEFQNLGTATAEQLVQMDIEHRKTNEALYNKIPQDKRYDVIGPRGTGYVAPIIDAQERPINRDRDVFHVPGPAAVFQRGRARAQAQPQVAPTHTMEMRKRAAKK